MKTGWQTGKVLERKDSTGDYIAVPERGGAETILKGSRDREIFPGHPVDFNPIRTAGKFFAFPGFYLFEGDEPEQEVPVIIRNPQITLWYSAQKGIERIAEEVLYELIRSRNNGSLGRRARDLIFEGNRFSNFGDVKYGLLDREPPESENHRGYYVLLGSLKVPTIGVPTLDSGIKEQLSARGLKDTEIALITPGIAILDGCAKKGIPISFGIDGTTQTMSAAVYLQRIFFNHYFTPKENIEKLITDIGNEICSRFIL